MKGSEHLRELVARALAEDLGEGDITSQATVSDDARASARIVRKEAGVVCGLEVAAECFRQTGAGTLEPLVEEGGWGDDAPRDVARIAGPARALLAAERTALNFLCHLSGVATTTARYARLIAGTKAHVLDTRKTTPGMRELEKAAVAAGGGHNHRLGLYDAILIKENHVVLAGGITEAIRRAREARPDQEVEVECRNLDELDEALAANAEWILLDNMSLDELRAAVERCSAGPGCRAVLEASGGVSLDNVAEVAATGVDYVSVGALTHSAPVLDLSLLLEPEPST